MELSDEQKALVKEAAKAAVEEAATQFYASVGRSVVTKILTWIGLLVVGAAAGHWWFKP